MKRRTGLLFSSAVAAGLIGGAASGFAIQQGRAATPLPPVPHTVAKGIAPLAVEAKDPSADDGAKLNGDLRDLLLEKPADAHDPTYLPARDWMSVGDLAEYWPQADNEFAWLNAHHFRRAARAVWDLKDGTQVEIDLVQFRSSDDAGAFIDDVDFPTNVNTPTVQGTGTGFVGRYPSKSKDGMYTGYGLVRHGDVVEQVFVDRKQAPPSLDEVMKVTQGQADRL